MNLNFCRWTQIKNECIFTKKIHSVEYVSKQINTLGLFLVVPIYMSEKITSWLKKKKVG